MHTNLILTVKITEDCRFAFAGCLKGSMEMLAVDMGQIPMWRQHPSSSREQGRGPRMRVTSQAPARVRTFNHLDPKLRGFGAVSRLKPLREGVADEKYVLICGKGIKSVHVWLFTPAAGSQSTPHSIAAPPPPVHDTLENGASANSPDTVGGPVWTFLFDVATNGVTIEALGFRFFPAATSPLEQSGSGSGTGGDSDLSAAVALPVAVPVSVSGSKDPSEVVDKNDLVEGGSSSTRSRATNEPMLQMLSKSRGMCVRVWNLVDLDRDMSEENESDLGKLPYEDIPNSQDTRAFSDDGELAFGGLYNFSVLRLDAPKWANR
jgi:hypothetical protein